MRQHRGRRASRVIAECRRHPIISHGVGASRVVPKRQLTARRRRGECLGNTGIAVRRTGATDARGVGAAVAAGDNRSRSGRSCPTA